MSFSRPGNNVGRSVFWLASGLTLVAIATSAGDWPQFRGPTFDGVSSERINKEWTGSVTNPVWLVPLGYAQSSLAVSGGGVVTQGRRNIEGAEREVCVALNASNGVELWATDVDIADYPDGGVGPDDGPRTTPAIVGDSVYVLTSYLKLFRLNAANGGVIWQKDLLALYGGSVINYQNAASPLVDSGRIYVNTGATSSNLMAFNTSDGELVWRSQDEAMTHATPTLATIHGVTQVIFPAQSGLVSLNPQNGAFLWRFNYPFVYNLSLATSPVVYDDMVYVCGTDAYGMGSVVAQVDFTNNTWTTTQLWWTNNPSSYWMTPIVWRGFLYGQFGVGQFLYANGQLKCIDMRTGNVQWSVAGFGRAGLDLVDDHLVVLTELGDLVLARPDTNSYIELGRLLAIPDFNQYSNRCWAMPAVCDGKVYVRSTSKAAAFDISIPSLKLDVPQMFPASKLELTIRTSDGSPIASNRFAEMEVRASTNFALQRDLWPRLTNALTLSNGVVRVTNINAAPARTFFLVTEPK